MEGRLSTIQCWEVTLMCVNKSGTTEDLNRRGGSSKPSPREGSFEGKTSEGNEGK